MDPSLIRIHKQQGILHRFLRMDIHLHTDIPTRSRLIRRLLIRAILEVSLTHMDIMQVDHEIFILLKTLLDMGIMDILLTADRWQVQVQVLADRCQIGPDTTVLRARCLCLSQTTEEEDQDTSLHRTWVRMGTISHMDNGDHRTRRMRRPTTGMGMVPQHQCTLTRVTMKTRPDRYQ